MSDLVRELEGQLAVALEVLLEPVRPHVGRNSLQLLLHPRTSSSAGQGGRRWKKPPSRRGFADDLWLTTCQKVSVTVKKLGGPGSTAKSRWLGSGPTIKFGSLGGADRPGASASRQASGFRKLR